ncbi:hypothetical protein [Algoriphagus pacificus]|uniref:DUF4383 domain-containing protein n=1 Tax=Algoriphagus pacificus TaxID=2811234 RepID=A0ABS3CEI9_9BACT|nr:hypothetical protein [Algoriphagus pacificus]MBN7815493.1 hypothetical protein [Algoriphagus pacificus]
MNLNTKLIFTLSAVFLGLIGIDLAFIPQETAAFFGLPEAASIFLQLTGALYFGFAMINWMVRGSTIGGIYNRPIAVGNFTHFIMGALALLKFLPQHFDQIPFLILAGIYTVFAVIFALILFTHPLQTKNGKST